MRKQKKHLLLDSRHEERRYFCYLQRKHPPAYPEAPLSRKNSRIKPIRRA